MGTVLGPVKLGVEAQLPIKDIENVNLLTQSKRLLRPTTCYPTIISLFHALG